MNNKTALITGATGGLGREFAHLHAAKGNDVFLISKTQTALVALQAELTATYRASVHILAIDLSQVDAAEKIYEYAQTQNIEVEYLINNAGFGGRGEFAQRTMEEDISMLAVNVVTLTKLVKLFLPDFLHRGSGRILNVSSTAALTPGPLQAEYYATKAYVTSLSNAIWQEVQGTNISVTALMPGAMTTGFAATSGMGDTALFANAVAPKAVAEAGYNGMMKGKLNVIAGLTFWQKPMMMLMPLMPKKMVMKLIQQMQSIK